MSMIKKCVQSLLNLESDSDELEDQIILTLLCWKTCEKLFYSCKTHGEFILGMNVPMENTESNTV